MSTTVTPADTVCIPDELSLPDGPFTALRYHFGMLLGVDDFGTEQRYHRGKMRLHNAWLHGAGIVWGLDVDVVQDGREVRVAPGLALDPTGRELHLDVRCCMDLGAWYDDNADTVQATKTATGVQFDGRVELEFCSCGTRPVPAMSQPCEGADVDTAYSRTFETVAIRFLPEIVDPAPAPYPRLRLLFGLDDGAALSEADRDAVVQARADVLALTADAQPAALLAQFRAFADLDTVELKPAETPSDTRPSPYPATDDKGVVLANLRDVVLDGATGSWTLTSWTLERLPRRAHVATETIEELLCGRVLEGGAGGGGSAPGDAGGPRVTKIEIDRPGKKVTLTLSKAVDPATVGHDAFRVARLESAGWEPIKVRSVTPSGDGLTVVVNLRVDPGTSLLRFIAHGTGQTPLLGADHVPLAGGADSPPGSADDGHDYVHMST